MKNDMDEAKFKKIVEVVKQDLSSIRTGKASPALVENVLVDAYGSKMKLLELATITVSDPTTLLVTPFDVSNIEAIVKAISDANLGLTALPDETRVRVIVPSLSEERRQEFVKLAKMKVDGGKIMVRQLRHEEMENAAKNSTDEDTKTRSEKDIQAEVDRVNEELDQLFFAKEKELLTV